MKILNTHPVFNLLKEENLKQIIQSLEDFKTDPLQIISAITNNNTPYDTIIIDSLKDILQNKIKYLILSESVVKLSEAINPDKLIDKEGHWQNAIINEYSGVILYKNFILLFSLRKKKNRRIVYRL